MNTIVQGFDKLLIKPKYNVDNESNLSAHVINQLSITNINY